MKLHILVVDDMPDMRETITLLLGDMHYVYEAGNESEALHIIERQTIHVILLDINLGNTSGIDLIPKIKQIDPDVKIIMITVESDPEIIITCLRAGAFDYQIKPLNRDKLLSAIQRAECEIELQVTKDYISWNTEEQSKEYQMIGNSLLMKNLYRKLEQIASVEINVLITGETGAGKELAARNLHRMGLRSKKPFFPVNCAAIPVNLVESELFGYEAGAFTGAKSRKKGMFELANSGTIFLDEISELNVEAQSKLLRVVQSGEFIRLSGTKIIKTDVQIYSSSNRNLEQWIKEGKFREDLYYRLKGIEVTVPPLRERREDIPLLVEHFIKKHSQKHKIPPKRIDLKVIEYMQNSCPWAGNVRELENFVLDMIALVKSNTISLKDITELITKDSESKEMHQYINQQLNSIPMTKAALEKVHKKISREISSLLYQNFLERLRTQFHGNITDIVKNSKIERTYLYRIINQSGLKPKDLKN